MLNKYILIQLHFLQHFPLYRESDASCTEPDAPPFPERNIRFRPKIEALSKEATDFLAEKVQPRVVFGGHTHHGCLQHHEYGDVKFEEHSVPSFSWRNRPDPKYMLVSLFIYYLYAKYSDYSLGQTKQKFHETDIKSSLPIDVCHLFNFNNIRTACIFFSESCIKNEESA